MPTVLTSSQIRENGFSLMGQLSLSEVISALTFALDLTEGAVPGHALRSCLLGMRLAESLGLSHELRSSLYYALLLKDCGCSSNSSRMYQIVGGDDRELKAASKLANFTKPYKPDARTARKVWAQVAPGASLTRRTLRLLHMIKTKQQNTRELIELRCHRGAGIMRQLEMDATASDAVMHLDEYWDGTGYPEQLCGQGIPLLARICSVAQNLDVFGTEYGPEKALAVVRMRSGTWFDPELVRLVESLHRAGTLWAQCGPIAIETTRQAVLDLDPRLHQPLSPERVDRLCEAFAEVVDAKSPFTFSHSMGVANVAEEIAREMGMSAERTHWMRRTALLHDIGKLRVPNSMLEKPGKLTPDEWLVLKLHPGLTRSILERISSFRELAIVAGEHHEKLDGSGYPHGLKAADLSMESRLLTVADIFAALAEDRPYRSGFELKETLRIMEKQTPTQLDPECFEAVAAAASRWSGKLPEKTRTPLVSDESTCCWMPTPDFAVR